jgi:carbonic anhydrase
MNTQTKDIQTKITPLAALQLLVEGNERYTKNSEWNRNLLEQVKETSAGQYPFAVVLSCIDSRVPAEIVFDQGIGDIFSIRIAGNFINDDILGSMEFACKVAGSKLIVVLGHSSCGAVKGACDNVELGNLTAMLSKIKPAVDAVEEDGDRSSANPAFVQKVSDKNVELAIEQIKARSSVLNEMLESKQIEIVGGMYSVETGNVTFN